jgi:putative endonuclease
MYYVYILQSLESGEFYKGLTNNINRRLIQHFACEVKSTKSTLPLKLVHVEICKSRLEARKLEKYFKSGFGREIIKEILEYL